MNFSDPRMSDIERLNLCIDYLKIFFTDKLIKHIAHYTNLYCDQQNITKNSTATDRDEMEKYINILLRISVMKAPYYKNTEKMIHGMTKYVLK